MLNEKDAIFDKIRKSGKEDLFAEFLYFHRFGSSGEPSCYDHSLFRTHGVAILEDFVITLADGVASIYLELISVDSKFSNEMNSGGLDICNLSSRALQKLRNEVKEKQKTLPLSLVSRYISSLIDKVSFLLDRLLYTNGCIRIWKQLCQCMRIGLTSTFFKLRLSTTLVVVIQKAVVGGESSHREKTNLPHHHPYDTQ